MFYNYLPVNKENHESTEILRKPKQTGSGRAIRANGKTVILKDLEP